MIKLNANRIYPAVDAVMTATLPANRFDSGFSASDEYRRNSTVTGNRVAEILWKLTNIFDELTIAMAIVEYDFRKIFRNK